MLKQIRNAANVARLSGFKATADAMDMFADAHIKTSVKLFAVEGEKVLLNQEKDIGIERSRASAKNC